MYRYKKAGNKKIKNVLIILTVIILTAILTIILYKMYEGIDIYTYNTGNSNIAATKTIQEVDNIKENSKQVADMIEDVTSCVVGISKIKSILLFL